jgi:hypothetical protein
MTSNPSGPRYPLAFPMPHYQEPDT